MKEIIKNKHWYTESFDYADDTDISWLGEEKFWLDEDGELIVNIARVYGVDEFAFAKEHDIKISEIINEMKIDSPLEPLNFIYKNNGEINLWYSFEPSGIQIGGRLRLADFEQWESKWHKLLEEAEFPYKYDDDPDFNY